MACISTIPTHVIDNGVDAEPVDLHTLALIRLAMQRHTAMFTANMAGGLTQTQFATMARLLETGPCSQNHLGRLVFLDASTINGVVTRLKGRGLIETRDDPDDIRLSILSLSRKGRRLIRSAIDIATRVNDETLQPLSPEDRDLLTSLLRKLGHPPAAVGSDEPTAQVSRRTRSKQAVANDKIAKRRQKGSPASGDVARRAKIVQPASDAALKARR